MRALLLSTVALIASQISGGARDSRGRLLKSLHWENCALAAPDQLICRMKSSSGPLRLLSVVLTA